MRCKAVDAVISDMAPPTTGHASTDHLNIIMLVTSAYDFAEQVLKPGGLFLAKLFQGGADQDLLKRLKADFEAVKHVKPDSSRKEAKEIFVVATGFKGKKSNTNSPAS